MVFLRELKLGYRTEVPWKTADANDKASEIVVWVFLPICTGVVNLSNIYPDWWDSTALLPWSLILEKLFTPQHTINKQ